MGLQKTTVNFVEKVKETARLLQRGSVAILLKANSQNVYSFKNYEEAKSKLKADTVKLSADGEKALELVFRGAINRPATVYVGFCNTPEAITDSLAAFEAVKFDWFCAPEFDTKHSEVVTWIKNLNEKRNMEVKAVITGVKADCEWIVNFTSKKIVIDSIGGKDNQEVTTPIMTARVASALAGTPLTRAITNLKLADVVSVERLSNPEYDAKIEAGELVLYNDWDEVRFGRGVTSLTTLGEKSKEKKKILIISKMHLWSREVKALSNKSYMGAMQNGINEKMLLVTAIKQYNKELASKGVILESSNEEDVCIDIEAQEKYLQNEKNLDTSTWNEKAIKDAKTESFVFIKANLSFTDAMEDIQIKVVC